MPAPEPGMNLVGRGAELAALRDALAGARNGRGRLVLLTGEPGIGKSALAEALAEVAAGDGFTVVRGRAWDLAATPAYFAVSSGLQSLGLAPPAEAEQVFAWWQEVLARLAQVNSPVLWTLDDLHAADGPTLELLAFLARPLHMLRVLVVATCRPSAHAESVARIWTRLAREAQELALPPLSAADVGTLAACAARRPLAPGEQRLVGERAGGNPLFVVECARSLSASGSHRLPDTVHQVVRERAAALPSASGDLLRLMAVLGDEVDAGLVAAVAAELPATVNPVAQHAAARARDEPDHHLRLVASVVPAVPPHPQGRLDNVPHAKLPGGEHPEATLVGPDRGGERLDDVGASCVGSDSLAALPPSRTTSCRIRLSSAPRIHWTTSRPGPPLHRVVRTRPGALASCPSCPCPTRLCARLTYVRCRFPPNLFARA